jgi:PEP-CTERM motif
MDKRTVRKLTAAMGLGASLLIGSSFVSSAWAAPCAVGGSIASYEALGAGGCTVGPLTFSDFSFTASSVGAALVTLTSVSPFDQTINGHTEYGFLLAYAAGAGPGPGIADVGVTYNVSDSSGKITDAYINLNGSVTGAGVASLSELILANGKTLVVNSIPGSDWISFPGISSSGIEKDQENDTLAGGTVLTSQLVDAYSVGGQVPEPGTIALFGAGLLAGGIFLRRRRLSIH